MKMAGHSPSQQRECPGDVLMLIFEEVYSTAPASVRDLRLVSRQFNILINPIVYRQLKLNKAFSKIFEVDSESIDPPEVVDARRRVKSAICTFTRQVTIDKVLDWSLVVNLLLSLVTFRHLNWSFSKMARYEYPLAGQRSSRMDNGMPQSILNCLTERWPRATLSVENLYLNLYSVREGCSLHLNTLVFLKLHTTFSWRLINQQTLKTFLMQLNRLKVLHFLNVQPGSRFLDEEIAKSERLPAVEELFLQGYFWLHSPSVATNFWDWSNLTSLRLEKVFIINFLDSVSPENLLQLRSLITDGHCESAVDHTKVSVLVLKAMILLSSRSASINPNADCHRQHTLW